MITVTDTGGAITISGHAGYADKGHDIVCEAVSSLVQTTFASVQAETASYAYTIAESGRAMLRVPDDARPEVLTLVRHLRRGLKILANAYPSFITYEDKTENKEDI